MRKIAFFQLPGEEVRGILEAISQLNSDTGWEFLYPVDTYFLESNRVKYISSFICSI